MVRLAGLVAAVLSLSVALPAAAATPAELRDFVGAKGGQAEMGLGNLGWTYDHSHGLTAFWYKGNKCVAIVTANGRYKSISTVNKDHCTSHPTSTGSGSGYASSPGAMMEDCRQYAAGKFGADPYTIEPKYEGQRTDGTHAVNADYYSAEGLITLQCSFNRNGTKIVDFVIN